MLQTQIQKWTVLIYTMVLVVIGVFMATVILNIAVQLSLEYDIRNVENSLVSTINTKWDLTMKYASDLNNTWGWFQDIVSCPQGFTMSWATVLDTNINSEITYMSWSISCDAVFDGNQVQLFFNTSFDDLDFVQFNGTQVFINSGSLLATFPDAENTTINVTSAYPLLPDWIDDNFDSDNYAVSSTWSMYYPDNYIDNDANARLVNYWYIVENSGFFNVFWSNLQMKNFINTNPYNLDGINAPIWNIGSGALYLDINSPFRLKLYVLDTNAYSETKELIITQTLTGTGSSAGIWYLQNDLSLGTGTGSAYNFDFVNNDYALFMENTLPDATLLYRVTWYDKLTGSWIYLNALDDSKVSIFTYLWSHMLIDDVGRLIGKQYEVFGLK